MNTRSDVLAEAKAMIGEADFSRLSSFWKAKLGSHESVIYFLGVMAGYRIGERSGIKWATANVEQIMSGAEPHDE
ncbi:MAG: hypothetical protein GTO63_30140 [Anaerolineae bacterium]|nr:hypothetical protein [Anaerolineae bacterium]NIN98966.1 hypothetical protein [Anaerolineae bacterium]